MLTPAQVKNHRFELSGRGHYRADEVDEFFEEVYDSYSQMFKENGDLVRKIGLLADKVEEYRNDEDNIRAALLTAQRMADKIVKEARESVEGQTAEASRNAQKMTDEAREKANAILEEAKFFSKESAEKANQAADKIKEQARAEAEQEAARIVSEAKGQLEAMNRELAQRAAELKELNHSVAAFKEQAAAVCGKFSALLDTLSEHAQEGLDQRVEEYVSARAAAVRPTAPAQPEPAAPAAETAPAVEPESSAEADVASAQGNKREEPVHVEIDPSVLGSDFSVSHQPAARAAAPDTPAEGGFKLNLDDLDKTADYRNLIPEQKEKNGEQLKFGDHYDIFEDDEEEEDRPNKPFLNFFKK